MHWRRPNNARAMREVQPYLGDCIGDDALPPLGPMLRKQYHGPRWVENGVAAVIGWAAFLFYGAVVSVFLAATFLLPRPAPAHEAANWISRGGFKNSIGEMCCGERDCVSISGHDVITTRAGFYIRSMNETVPYSEATPAPAEAGGLYWRCAWGGRRKCFFVPPGST